MSDPHTMTAKEFKRWFQFRSVNDRKCRNCMWFRRIERTDGPEVVGVYQCTGSVHPFHVSPYEDVCDAWKPREKRENEHDA